MREICYISQVAGFFGILFLLVTIDLLYLSLSFYIVAMYKELQGLLRCIDQQLNLNNSDEGHDQGQGLRDCIELHLAIIR